jgi:hypothetical protein
MSPFYSFEKELLTYLHVRSIPQFIAKAPETPRSCSHSRASFWVGEERVGAAGTLLGLTARSHALSAIRSFGYNPLARPNPGAFPRVDVFSRDISFPFSCFPHINLPHSTSHLRIPILRILIRRDPQHIVAPDQHLAEMALALSLDPLDGATELDVHVAVDADEAARVLGLAPLEADAHVVVDERLQHWPRVHGDEL